MHMFSIVVIASLLCLALALPGAGSSLAEAREQSYQALRRSVAKQALVGRDTKFTNHTSIAKSFDGAPLFSGTFELTPSNEVSLLVVCTTCYVKADITAELRVFSQANASAGIHDIVDKVKADVEGIATGITDNITDYLQHNTDDLIAAAVHLDLDQIALPTLDVDVGLAQLKQDRPDVQFSVTLDSFDLFVALSTSLSDSASYTLNLFTSQTEMGLRIDGDTEIGVTLTVDLILSADGAIEMDSGFHLKMEDGLKFFIDLFSDAVSSVVVNGGHFEFLPITVSGTVALNAILRVGIHAGVGVSSSTFTVLDKFDIDYGAGIDTVVFVDVANLTTIVSATTTTTTTTNSSSSSSNNNNSSSTTEIDAGRAAMCNGSAFAAAGVFELGVGAGVGASMVIDDLVSWGIGPTTVLPIYYTTVTSCASGSSVAAPATTTAAAAVRRDDDDDESVTTTISTTVIYSAVGCQSTGLVACPLSLQTTIKTSTELTTVLTLASSDDDASDPTWPANTATAGITTKPFGTAVSSMRLSVSGSPSSYTPPASTASPTPGTPGTITVHGHTVDFKNRNIAIGVGVGVGVPLLAFVAWGAVVCIKKRKQQQAMKGYHAPASDMAVAYGQ